MNVPQLRFKGFEGEWTEKKFYECVDINATMVDPKQSEYKEFPHIGPGNIEKHTGYLKGYKLVKEEELISGKYLFKETDIIYGKINPQLGKVAYPKLIGLCSADSYPLSPNLDLMLPYFLYQNLLNRRFLKFSISVSMRTGMPKINREELSVYKFFLPSLEEQRKIGGFLKLLDRRIHNQRKKIEKLEQFKKGMMQKIFSQDLRFKDEDGGEFPEWEEKKLGQVLKIKHGRDQKKIELPDGKFPILATGGVIGRTDTFIYDKESVLIGRKGTIDRPVFMDTPFWTVDTLFYSEIKENNFPKFVFYIFQSINWKLYNEASGVPSLSAKTIEAIKIMTPNYKEQKIIADYLSIIDKKIEKEKEKLLVLEKQKKGFMQVMFV